MKRYVEFSKYRNLGFDFPDKIVLNKTMEKGKMGDLIIVIGENNAGKSNVLDAICNVGKQLINKNDITRLDFSNESQNPKVSLCFDGLKSEAIDINGISYGKIKLESTLDKVELTALKTDSVTLQNLAADEKSFIFFKNYILGLFRERGTNKIYFYRESDLNVINSLVSLVFSLENFASFFEKLTSLLSIKSSNSPYTYSNNSIPLFINLFRDVDEKDEIRKNIYFKYFNQIFFGGKETIDNINAGFYKKYGTYFYSKVYKYSDTIASSYNLESRLDNIESNKILISLFKYIDYKIDNLRNLFKLNNNSSLKGYLEAEESKINRKIKKVNDLFNKIYNSKKEKYNFKIYIETSKNILLTVSKGDITLDLSLSSVGFKWFFNFFFIFILNNSLLPGDIVVMDEPATNMHIFGQIELRNFLKDFAIKSDVTFVIATHSPFFIDVDNYDELRIVTYNEGKAYVEDNFCAINDSDTDSPQGIKKALTINGNNILYDYDNEVVLVEGLTDYCYLVMFKRLLDIKDIVFVPFNGVGNKYNDENKKVLEKICNMKFVNSSILIDNDKAGKEFEKLAVNTKYQDKIYDLSILNTNDKTYKEIEDLFSEEDISKYNLLSKDTYHASVLKNTAKLEDFSNETINNFKKLFKLLKE